MAHEDVTRTVSSYVAGMEADPEFCGVSFRRSVPETVRAAIFAAEAGKDAVALKTAIAAKNKAGSELAAEICKKYSVKPLGATSTPGGVKTLEKVLLGWLNLKVDETGKTPAAIAAAMLKPDYMPKLQRVYKSQHGKDVTIEQITEILGKVV